MNSINLFDNLKIHKVDSSDSHIRKTSLITQNGSIEIQINDNNDPELVLYSDESSNRSIYLNCKLHELDLNLIENSSSRIELNKNDKRLKFRYLIEFSDDQKRAEFKEIIRNLDEIFLLSSKIEPINEDVEMKFNQPQQQQQQNQILNIKEICIELEKSIVNGDVENAGFYAQELAKNSVNIEILIKDKKTEENKSDDQVDQSRIKISVRQGDDKEEKKSELLLSTKEFTILDLKMQVCKTWIYLQKKNYFNLYSFKIEANFKIAPVDQILIINDFNTNDGDLLEDYRIIRPSTSAQADSVNDFNAIVFIKNQNSHIEQLIDAKKVILKKIF